LSFIFINVLLIVLILRRATTGNVSAQIAALYQPGKLIDQRPVFKDKKRVVAMHFQDYLICGVGLLFLLIKKLFNASVINKEHGNCF